MQPLMMGEYMHGGVSQLATMFPAGAGAPAAKRRRGGEGKTPTCAMCKQPKVAGSHPRVGCPFVCNECKKRPDACTCEGGATLISPTTQA
jgi:hypothetical protein